MTEDSRDDETSRPVLKAKMAQRDSRTGDVRLRQVIASQKLLHYDNIEYLEDC